MAMCLSVGFVSRRVEGSILIQVDLFFVPRYLYDDCWALKKGFVSILSPASFGNPSVTFLKILFLIMQSINICVQVFIHLFNTC